MLIEQVTQPGTFELIFNTLSTFGNFIPAIFGFWAGLSVQAKQITIILAFIFGRTLFIKLKDLLIRFKNYLEFKL